MAQETAVQPDTYDGWLPRGYTLISRDRLDQLEYDRRINAGRRRIIARALRAQGFTGREIARLLRVSPSQAYADLKVRDT